MKPRQTLATLALAIALGLSGCSSKAVTEPTIAPIIASAETADKRPARKSDAETAHIVLRCGSTLTKTGKPCRNRVKEDSFCHLHAEKEAAKEKAKR